MLRRDGEKNRKKGETLMNSESSRSHSIFIIQIFAEAKQGTNARSTWSKLALVDLAGSENANNALGHGIERARYLHLNKF